MESKSASLIVFLFLITSILCASLQFVPKGVQASIVTVVPEPYIFVPSGEGSELLMDNDQNLYWLHIVSGDVFFRKYNSKHVLVIPDKPLFTNGSNENVDAVFDPVDNIHLTWATDFFGAQSIMYLKIDKSGDSLVPPTKLSGDNNARDHASVIEVNSLGQAYVIWDHWWDPNDWLAEDVLYAKIDSDGSIVFTQEYVAPESWDTDFYARKDIIVDSYDNLHVFFDRVYRFSHDIHIYYKKYASDGSTVLVSEKQLIQENYYYWSSSAEATLDSQAKINLAYSYGVAGGQIEVFYARMDLQGNVEVGPIRLSDKDSYHSHQAHLALDRYDNSYVFWRENKDGNAEVYYAVVDANGTTALSASRVTVSAENESVYYMGALFDDTDFCIWSYYNEEGTYVIYPEPTEETLEAEVDCDPDTLNLKSRGNWITCYIELPVGYNPEDIDATTILLNGVLKPELDSKYGFVKDADSYIVDHDGDGIFERMVKFDRSAVEEILSPGESVLLVITGQLYDGTEFEGSDVIRVIDPPLPKCSPILQQRVIGYKGTTWVSFFCWQRGSYGRT